MKRKPTKQQPSTVSAAPGASAAFEELAEEIASIRDEDVLPINVDIERAASIALAAASHLAPLAPQFKALPDFDHQTAGRLRTYALAALYAHVVANEASQDEGRFTPVLHEATKLRELLLGAAELLSLFGLVSAERVADIRAGTGHLDTASDLIALHALFVEHWKRVDGKTPVTREQVERAGVLGTEMHELVASRKFAAPGEPASDDPQRVRARAFTLLVRKYDECRRGVTYLRWKFGDADTFAPSMYLRGRRRPSAGGDAETPATEAPVPVPADVVPSPIGDVAID